MHFLWMHGIILWFAIKNANLKCVRAIQNLSLQVIILFKGRNIYNIILSTRQRMQFVLLFYVCANKGEHIVVQLQLYKNRVTAVCMHNKQKKKEEEERWTKEKGNDDK